MNAVVVRLSDLAFLSPADLSGACSESELGEKILQQFAFLPGDLRVTITDGTARIEYREPAAEKLSEAQRLSEQAAQSAKSGDFQQALHLFTQALAANPALSVARRDLAMLHYELGVLVRSPSRSPALGRASHGDTKTRRKVLGRNADVLVGIIASLRSGFRSPVSAFSVALHVCRIQTHRSRSGSRRGSKIWHG